MIYFFEHFSHPKTRRAIFISSDKYTGIIENPIPFKGAIETNNPSDQLDIIGMGKVSGIKLHDFETLSLDPKDHNLPFNSRIVKIWQLQEQYAYFFPRDKYEELFGGINLNPRVLFFDIEIGNQLKEAPNPDKHPVLMIGIKTLETDPIIIDETKEEDTIVSFLKYVETIDPHIICGYFSRSFDSYFILKRMQILNIPFPKSLHRYTPPHLQKIEREGQHLQSSFHLAFGYGRTHFDLYNAVRLDTSLTGKVKSRKMKDICVHYKSKTIFDLEETEKQNMLSLYNTDREKMRKYLYSDVLQPEFLFRIYYPQFASFADDVTVSFDSIVNAPGRAPYPKLFMGKSFVETGQYPVFKNKERNKQLYQYTRNGRFRGAFTGIRKTGRFSQVAKVDFACVDDKTQAFTKTGWKFLRELSLFEEILIWNKDTSAFSFGPVMLLHSYDFSDNLYTVNKPGCSMMVTENHRLFQYGEEEVKIIQAFDIPVILGESGGQIEIPSASIYTPQAACTTPYLSLIPYFWLFSPEVFTNRDSNSFTKKQQEVIHGYSETLFKYLLLNGFLYDKNKNKDFPEEIVVSTPEIYNIANNVRHITGEETYNIFFNISQEERVSFINTCLNLSRTFYSEKSFSGFDADSKQKGRTKRIASVFSFKDAASAFQLVCHISGFSTYLKEIKRNGIVYYVVLVINRSFISFNNYTFTEYTGKVWCPTVSTGAWVCKRDNAIHVTGNSMYPSIIVTFNLSPETVKFVGTKDLVMPQQKPKLKMNVGVMKDDYYPTLIERFDEESITISIPDDEISKYLTFRINQITPGVLSQKVEWILDTRKKLKKQMESLNKDTTEYKMLDSAQNSKKVAANSIFGICGNPFFEAGDLGCAMLITAFGREISHYICSVANSIGEVIEIDTDGIYLTGNIDINFLNSDLDETLREKYRRFPVKQRMVLDLEKQNMDALFLKMKNYILVERAVPPETTDKITVMGSSMKGSTKPFFIDYLIQETASMVLNWEDLLVIRSKVDDLINNYPWKPEDFVINQSITRDIDDYSSDGGIIEFLKDILDTDISFNEALIRMEKQLNKYLSSYTPEESVAFLVSWKSWVGTSRINTIQDLVYGTDNLIYMFLGAPKKSPLSMAVQIIKKAIYSGSIVMIGESIRYYHAQGPEKIQIFTPENIQKYPINKHWYIKMAQRVIDSILSTINNQETSSIF